MKLVFWTKEYNYHWLYIYKSLAPLVGGNVTVIVQNELSEYRKRVGWSDDDGGGFTTRVIAKGNWLCEAVKFIRENRDAVHFFLGFTGKWCTTYIFPLILYSLLLNIKTVVMVEHYSRSATGYYRDEPKLLSWLKVHLRPAVYRFSAAVMKTFAKKDTLYFLAQSPLAKETMVQAGIDERSVFCFGYFVPRDPIPETAPQKGVGTLRLVYVGSLIRRKGVDLVIDALNEINVVKPRICFDVYGPGAEEATFLKKSPGVEFKGILSQNQVQSTVAQYDMLILPSRHDGWGVVVNEALLQGVPVMVSDQAGSSCLVRSTNAGMVFKSGDVNDLYEKFRLLLDDPGLMKDYRRNAGKVAELISPDVAARYLVEVLNFYLHPDQNHSLPVAIWS